MTNRTGSTRALRILLLSACSLGAMPGIAAAQDAPADDTIVVTGTSAITATKTDTPILRTPQAIEVITTEEIQERGGQTIREALLYTAGVSGLTGGDDSRGDFNAIRGFESVLYVDGLKRNYGFVYLPRPDINTLERVEVLVGPASVLYGAGSSGGLTNMQSKRPQFEFGGSASISYGTFDRKEAVLDVTGPLGEDLAVRFVGVLRDSDSRMDYTPNDRQLAQGAVTWKPTDRTDITAIGIYQFDRNPPNYNIVPLGNSLFATPGKFIPGSRFFGEPNINKGDKEYTAASLLATHEFNDWLSLRSNTRYTWANTEQAEYYLATYYGSSPLNPFITGSTTRVPRNLFAINISYNTFNTDNSLAFKFNTGGIRHQLLAGIDYSYFKQDSNQAFVAFADSIDIYNPVYGTAPAPIYNFPNIQVLKQTGFYLQDQVDFGEFASLVLGIRRDRYTKQDAGQSLEETSRTTKRAGLTVNVTPTLAPYVSYSESFLPISGLNQFGSTYKPLSGEQKEIGIKWQPLRSTMLRVSLYDLEEANALQPDPNNPLDSIQTGSVRARGIEFQANHNVKDDLSLTASFSYSSVRISGQNYQRDATPQYLASLFGSKAFELGNALRLRIGAGARYVGPTRSFEPFSGFLVNTPSYTLVDALAAFEYRNWSLQLNAVNMLDKTYYPGCSWYGSCANGEPRTVQATLGFRF
ncbi:TonB-dependent siderophore receptor [Sphingomonas sp. MG17]|uniref:TonB-dependent siderophore receptor n=1 Tax=Sphingomonas tagetis TaxID=2949092 RepID=A0A9X2HJP8_9SPHN|nr:TonB-dependent siderophore receptor [Sphingomonas tagetis]MCP3730897.1 TonB-dependent siderophore receptor [Sphingomonas tagetis]